MKQLLLDLKPFLTTSYMSVRDRLGSMFTNIFMHDLHFEGKGGNQRNPKMEDFINEILPALECLANEDDRENSPEVQPMQEGSPPPGPMMRPPGPLMGPPGHMGPSGPMGPGRMVSTYAGTFAFSQKRKIVRNLFSRKINCKISHFKKWTIWRFVAIWRPQLCNI